MEIVVNIQIEKLPEGVYLATSDEMPGLVAQGATGMGTLDIARDVARKLNESRTSRGLALPHLPVGDSFEYPLIVDL